MSRVFNFSAGPATLPEAVLEQVRDELLDWRGTGMSVMEMSHRDKPFMSIATEAEADLQVEKQAALDAQAAGHASQIAALRTQMAEQIRERLLTLAGYDTPGRA